MDFKKVKIGQSIKEENKVINDNFDNAVNVDKLGQPDGVATLDGSGKVTSTQLPDIPIANDINMTGYVKPGATSPIESTDTVDGAIGKLERKTDDTSAKVTANTDSINDLQAVATEHDDEIEDLKTLTEQQGTKIINNIVEINELNTKTEQHETDISALNIKVNSNTMKISALETKTANHDTAIEILESRSAEIEHNIDEIKGDINTINGQISDLGNNVNTNTTAIQGLRADVDDHDTAIANLETADSDMAEDITAIDERVTALEDGGIDIDTEKIFRETANAITVTTDTSPSHTINDISPTWQGLRELTMYGTTTQNGTPTPDNPVDVVSVTEPAITVMGRNLLSPSIASGSAAGFDVTWATLKDEPTISLTGTFTGTSSNGRSLLKPYTGRAKLRAGVTYTIRAELISGSYSGSVLFMLSNIDPTGSPYFAAGVESSAQIVPVTDIEVYAGIHVSSGAVLNAAVFRLQVEQGTVATPFEPYTSTSATLTGITLNSIGDVRDTVEVRDGKVILTQRVWTQILKGTETIYDYPTYNGFTFVTTGIGMEPMRSGTRQEGYSNIGPALLPGTSAAVIGVWFGVSNQLIYVINISSTMGQTISEKVAYIKAQYANGTPITLTYILDTPIVTDITNTVNGQALLALQGVYPTTTITCDTDCVVTYNQDVNARLAQLETIIQQLITAVNGG
jgi:Chromosome segregation ATPases